VGFPNKKDDKKFVFNKGSYKSQCAFMLMLIKQKDPQSWLFLKEAFTKVEDDKSFEFYEKLVAFYRGDKTVFEQTNEVKSNVLPLKKPAEKQIKKVAKKSEDKKTKSIKTKSESEKVAKKEAKKTTKKVAKKTAKKKVAKKVAKKKVVKTTAKKATAKKVTKKTATKKTAAKKVAPKKTTKKVTKRRTVKKAA
jgi:hypothetical protein